MTPIRRVLVVSHAYVDPAARGKLRALAARGLEVTVAVPQHWRERDLGRVRTTTWERQSGVELFPIPAGSDGDPERARFGGRALAALVRDKRPDLIQIEEEPWTKPAAQLASLARRLAIPVTLFTWDNVGGSRPLGARWRRGRVLRRLAGLVAGSTDAAALVRRTRPDLPVAVVSQLGVAVPTAPPHAAHEGLAIGCVGRLVPEKGVHTLLEALARNRAEAWHLVVAGDGPERERLEAHASRLRLAARVRWLGALPPEHIQGLWKELDVLVVPSRASAAWAERSGLLVAEAMAHEVAVVGAKVGALPEVIGDAGLVVPAEDPAALAAALAELGDPARHRALAQAGRARALKHYSDDAVAEVTLRFWREIVDESSAISRRPSAVRGDN
ncbi:MAG TPA: glycosyltransferase [Gemmatimonadales bacterium]|nr:glycosyltransferase [Gemmatimonadales bacterium]